MTTPTSQPTAQPAARHATRAHAARTVAVIGALFVALIGIAGAISVADSGDWRAGGLAIIAAVGAVAVAISAVRDIRDARTTGAR